MSENRKPDGTEDKAQLAKLGAHFRRVANGEVKPAPAPKPPGFTWGFTPEERARLERGRAPKKDGPK
jgi:hypothetical protein